MCPDTALTAAFDLFDPADRAVLSDWMEEHGRAAEAGLLRDGRQVLAWSTPRGGELRPLAGLFFMRQRQVLTGLLVRAGMEDGVAPYAPFFQPRDEGGDVLPQGWVCFVAWPDYAVLHVDDLARLLHGCAAADHPWMHFWEQNELLNHDPYAYPERSRP